MLPSRITPEAMRRLDALAQEKYGIPALVLMENAGSAVARAALKMLRRSRQKKVICICGGGNNGGDGFVAARHLINQGAATMVFLVGKTLPDLEGEAALNALILKKMGVRVLSLSGSPRRLEDFKNFLAHASLVIDAVFGIGFHGEVGPPVADIFEAVRRSGKRVLSVDVPSGLDARRGKAAGVCIKADATVTFALPKTGFFKNDGPRYVGKLIVADISIPKTLLAKYAVTS